MPQFTEVIGDSESISFAGILEIIIKFYALSGINIAIKFSEFYEFQKAYALLLGVLHKVGYNSYRSSIALKRAILNWHNLPKLIHIGTVSHLISSYWEQSNKYNDLDQKRDINVNYSNLPYNNQNNQIDNKNKTLKERIIEDLSLPIIDSYDLDQEKCLKYKIKYYKLMTSKQKLNN